MKKPKLFYRRKDKSIVIEGIASRKKVLITTLPSDPNKLLENLEKGSFFKPKKLNNIIKKLEGLYWRQQKSKTKIQ